LNNATTLTPCSKFHAFAVNASYYNYAFTSINSGLTYTLTNSPKTIDIMDVPSLLPNDTYQIKVMAVYRIANGMGQIENVVVVPAEICTKFIAPNAK